MQSNIQTVLIVTKARDNRLIKLTRELALYLMLKHRRGSKRGLVVYVNFAMKMLSIILIFAIDTWTVNFAIPRDLMPKVLCLIILSCLFLSRDGERRVANPYHPCPRIQHIKKTLKTANLGIGLVGCAVAAHIYSTSSLL